MDIIKDMNPKGVAFSVIAIIVLIGVLGLSIWSGYQLSIGSRYSSTYGDMSKQDAASFKMKSVKKDLEQALKFSANQAMIKVAANGGTESTTFWSCSQGSKNFVPRSTFLPSPEEVKSAVSSATLNYFNAFISSVNEEHKLFEIDVNLPKYSCVGTFDKGESVCSNDDSSDCENFWSTATAKSKIEIHKPVYISESDEIKAYIDNNRFFWIYYRLYNDYDDSFIQNYVCRGDIWRGGVEPRITSALDELCKHYKNELFDKDESGNPYVNCSYEILCFEERNPNACLNSECSRGEFTEADCEPPILKLSGYNSKTVNSKNSKTIYFEEECVPETTRIEWRGKDELRFRIKLTDNKYNIFGMRKDPIKLVWIINGIVEIDHTQCPIVWDETTNCPSGPPLPGPPEPQIPQPPKIGT